MNKKFLKRIIGCVLSASVTFSSIGLTSAYAADTTVLYEKKDVQTIAQGLTYEKSTRMYSSGWMDVYVLTMDASEEDLAFDVIETVDKYGGKATVEKLAKDNGVVAAVNGDFFGSGTLKSSMGQVAGDGDMIAAQNYYNGSENRYAGFFIDNYGTPFIDYVKSSMSFYSMNNTKTELGGKNKVTDFAKPVYFDRRAITSTATLDAYFKNLTKIVVEESKITYISNPGEIVDVPEKGFIIVMSNASRQTEISKYSVGMTVGFSESEKFVFREGKSITDIAVGLSGGGELLRNGQVVNNGLIIGENAYNPRTMLGVNQDKSKIFIVCIDGRKNGKGATHAEAAAIMKEYGAYDAIHLDGGGSTTMAVQTKTSTGPKVVNVPSEGSQRAVANGVGIKVNGEAGVPKRVEPYVGDADENIMFKDFESKIYVNVYDGQLAELPVDLGKLTFSSSIEGTWRDNIFTPSETGTGTITVNYGDISGTVEVTVLKGAAALRVGAEHYALGVGEKSYLTAKVINKDGYSIDADNDNIEWSVSDSAVGHIEDGYFVADSEGTCVVTGKGYDVSAKMTISVGKKFVALNSFEAPRNIVMYYYPENSGIEGNAETDSNVQYDGNSSIRIDYKFKENQTTTQSVYASLENNNIPFPEGVSDFSIWYKGDGSDNMLKAVITYGSGQSADVTISDNLNSKEWKQATVYLPADVTSPVYLNKIYVSSLNTTDENTEGTVYVDYLMAQAAVGNAGGVNSTNMQDYMEVDLSSLTGDFTTVTAFGTTKYIGSAGTKLINQMSEGARSMVFVGESGITNNSSVPSVINQNKYQTSENDDFSFVTLAVSNGSLKAASGDQWRYLQDYLNRLSKKNIVVMLDVYPWSGITDSREREALHDILKTASRKSDKNIVVISSVGESNYVEIKDGIRYINLAGVNAAKQQYIKFMGNSDELYYEFCDVE